MAIQELSFSKDGGSIPWGFRLTGGSDYDAPLQVVKVSKDSIAEQAGMQEGDLVVRINNVDTADLTHIQAHDVILQNGSGFIVAVVRGELADKEEEDVRKVQSDEFDQQQICIESIETEVKQSESHEISAQLCVTIETSEEIITEKQAEVSEQKIITGKVEIEKDHGFMGVDFQVPNVENIKNSEVLKVLNEESLEKTEARLRKEKKWSTFLEKPKRPKPKVKRDEQESSKEPPYRVVIVKGKKKESTEYPQASQESTPAQADSMATPEPMAEHEEPVQEQDDQQEYEEENIEKEQVETEDEPIEPVISEVEMSLEEQLVAVQKQLLALSQLPAAIQQTLDVVTSQLAKIVGPVNESNTEANEEPDEYNSEENEDVETDYEGELDVLDEIPEEESDQDGYHEDELEVDQDDGMEVQEEVEPEPEPEIEEELTEEEREVRRAEQEKEDKKQKILHWNNIWPWGDHLGRRIYRDSNCEFVPSKVMATKKINFLKYQPMPKTLDHLKNSEVYKLVHDLEPATRGVQSRAGKAMAEEDYYTQIHKEVPQEHTDALNK